MDVPSSFYICQAGVGTRKAGGSAGFSCFMEDLLRVTILGNGAGIKVKWAKARIIANFHQIIAG